MVNYPSLFSVPQMLQWWFNGYELEYIFFALFFKKCFQHQVTAYDLFTTYHQVHHLAWLAQRLGYFSAQCSKTTTDWAGSSPDNTYSRNISEELCMNVYVHLLLHFYRSMVKGWSTHSSCLLFNESAITANSKPITGVLNMYFESILTLNDMPIHKRYTYVEFVKLYSVQLLTKGPKAQMVKIVVAR